MYGFGESHSPKISFASSSETPPEDQGLFFDFIQASPPKFDAGTDEAVHRSNLNMYKSVPEAASIFQITFPTGDFGGMVTKPWSQRTKTTQQLMMESMGPLSKIAGVRVIPQAPPPLPGGGNFPVDLVIASSAEPEQLSDVAEQLVARARASGMFIFADADLKFDQPQAEVVFDRDKLRSQVWISARRAATCRRSSAPTT